MKTYRCGLTAGIVLMCALPAGGAFADEIPNYSTIPSPNPAAAAQITSPSASTGALSEGQGVMQRGRPEYDAIGVNLGDFILYPSLAASISADDNVFRAEAGARSDTFWTFSPRLDLRSQWSEDKLNLYAQSDSYEYDSQSSESHTNWIVGGTGRLNVLTGSYFDANAAYFSTHESRISPDLSPLAKSPTPYTQTHADLSFTNQPGPLGLSAGINFDRYDFSNTELFTGGSINNDDRDEDITEYFAKVLYAFTPDNSAFLRVSYNTHDFDLTFDRNGFDRTSDGYRADAGLQMMFTPLIKGTAFLGYLDQQYKAPLKGANGLDFGAQIDWYVTELVTFHFGASRQYYDTIIFGASTVDERSVTASFDYELLRNVILQGNASCADDKFIGIARDDTLKSAGLTVKYLMNNYASAYAGYEYSDRNSNAAGKDFTDNLITVGVRLQL